jgi:hypothetical protein
MGAFLVAFFLQWYHSQDIVVIGETTVVTAIYIGCMIWTVAVASESFAQTQETNDEETGLAHYAGQLWNRVVQRDRAL